MAVAIRHNAKAKKFVDKPKVSSIIMGKWGRCISLRIVAYDIASVGSMKFSIIQVRDTFRTMRRLPHTDRPGHGGPSIYFGKCFGTVKLAHEHSSTGTVLPYFPCSKSALIAKALYYRDEW